MKNDDRKDPDRRHAGDGAAALPYPDSDLSPGLQKTIYDKIQRGEIDEVDADDFFGIMQRAAPQTQPELDDEAS